MMRLWLRVVLAGLIAGVGGLSLSVAEEKEKVPSIKVIMTKAHKGGNSLLFGLGKDLKASSPDWPDIDKKAKELLKLGKGLGKNTPPKGEKASWEKLTKNYVTTAESLVDAVGKQDKSAAIAAQKKLTGMCAACHSAHKK